MVVLESEIETRMYLRDSKKSVEYAIPLHDYAEALTNNFISAIFV